MRRKNGKVIQVEKITIAGRRMEVPLRLVGSRDHHSQRIQDFHYEVHIDDPKVHVTHADPKECLNLAVAALEKLMTIVWEPLIAVRFEEGDECIYHGVGEVIGTGQLSIRVALVSRGTQKDGHVQFRGTKDEHWSRNVCVDELTTLIPDTPDNRSRVDAIVQGLNLLGQRLRDLLAPDRIAKTLLNLNLLALPAPEPKAKRVKRKKP